MSNQAKYLKVKTWMIFIIITCTLITTGLFVKATTVDEEIDNYFHYNDRPQKVVYLTFDDGPSIYTQELLHILKEFDVPAIFFLSGESIEVTPNSHDLIKKILEKNHHIGLHSMTHNRNRLYKRADSPKIFVDEMLELKKLIYDITGGYETDLCRAPYGKKGNFSSNHYKAVVKAGLYCIDWNLDSLDWSKKNTDQILDQVKKELEEKCFPDRIVALFHEKKLTVEALPEIIKYFHEKGYTFVYFVEGEVIEGLSE